MVPADERLDAEDFTVSQIDLGLVKDAELLLIDRRSQRAFDLAALRHTLAEVVVEELAADAPLLCAIHRRVGLSDQDVGIRVLLSRDHDADARGHERVVPFELHRTLDAPDDPFGDPNCLLLVGDVLAKDDELVASVPRRRVARAQCVIEPLRDLDQDLVAGFVAQAVIDELETIQVDEEDCESGAVSSRPGERMRQPVIEERAVRQAGQGVVQSLVGDLKLGLLALDRIADRAAELVAETRPLIR